MGWFPVPDFLYVYDLTNKIVVIRLPERRRARVQSPLRAMYFNLLIIQCTRTLYARTRIQWWRLNYARLTIHVNNCQSGTYSVIHMWWTYKKEYDVLKAVSFCSHYSHPEFSYSGIINEWNLCNMQWLIYDIFMITIKTSIFNYFKYSNELLMSSINNTIRNVCPCRGTWFMSHTCMGLIALFLYFYIDFCCWTAWTAIVRRWSHTDPSVNWVVTMCT